MLKRILLFAISLLPIAFILLALVTFLVATITWIRQYIKVVSSSTSSVTSLASLNTALYCGRVSHTRFQPLVHSFSYPLFFCLLDLSEVDVLFNDQRKERSLLWPLNLFMTFRDEDHLKNGEGMLNSSANEGRNDISSRIIRLVTEKTNGKCNPSPGEYLHVSVDATSCYIYFFSKQKTNSRRTYPHREI